MQTIKTTAVQITLRDDGILEIERLPEGETTADLVLEQIAAVRQLIGEKRRPLLWNPSGFLMTDPAAWKQWVEEAPDLFVAAAVIHDEEQGEPLSPYWAVNAMLIPLQVFVDEAEAVEWLSGFVDSPG